MEKRNGLCAQVIYLLTWCLCISSCHRGDQMVSLGVDEVYAVERMRTLVLHPEFTGDGYEWSLATNPDADPTAKHLTYDSLLSTSRDLIFCQADTGTYYLQLHIDDPDNPVWHRLKIVVWEEQVAYSPYITTVYEYRPAPGQFVNIMPEYQEGDTERDMAYKAQECISGTNQVMISLGAYGGYVTFGFDHSVCNVQGERDFRIVGNAFIADSKKEERMGGSCEPGIVMVSIDKNQNGLPDDEWYELAGSEYHKPTTVHDYQITYHRPSADHEPVKPEGRSPLTDLEYIRWTDNQGSVGFVQQNTYHKQDYFPAWLDTDEMTFTGTLLPPNAIDESGNGTYYVLYAYDWGYVDNAPNDYLDLNAFDISWAVDRYGNPVNLPCADFIRVYTAVNQTCGWLGETSTELSQAFDLHVPDPHALQKE